jgi:phosphomannomutase
MLGYLRHRGVMRNANAFIFDVDGTLTPSRVIISDEFRGFFTKFCQEHDVYLVSGSDHAKTLEQLGKEITDDLVKRVYSCSGNSIWENGIEIFTSAWTLPGAGKNHLRDRLFGSKCPTKTGNHFEYRPGTVNFSTVGRNANTEQRAEYIKFDNETGERASIVESFNTYFGSRLGCVALIGGETGIDITETNHVKSQILTDFVNRDVTFFGDRTAVGGNDYPLAAAILQRLRPNDVVFPVTSWRDTMFYLTQIIKDIK